MRRLLAHFWSDEGGLSAVEFALVSTFILVPLLLGATELGRRVWMKTQFENAAQAGMDYAALIRCPTVGFSQDCSIYSTPSFTAGIVNAVQTATSLSTAVTVAPPAGCGGQYYCFGCPSGSGVSLTATRREPSTRSRKRVRGRAACQFSRRPVVWSATQPGHSRPFWRMS